MKKNILVFLLFCVMSVRGGVVWGQSERDSLSKEVNKFLNILFNQYVYNNPEFATFIGIKTNYDKWAERHDAKYRSDYEMMLSGVKYLKSKYDIEKLDAATQLSVKLFENEAKSLEEYTNWRQHYYVFSQVQGSHVDVPNFLINFHLIDNEEDAKSYILRLKGIEKVFEADMAMVEKQRKMKIYPPKFTLSFVINDIQKILKGLETKGEDNILYTDLLNKLTKMNMREDVKKVFLEEAYDVLTKQVKTAYDKLLGLMMAVDAEVKESNGVWALPQGEAFYRHCLKSNTTTTYSPDSIYGIGQKEVARLHGEIKQVMAKMKYTKNLASFFEYLKTSSKFKYPNNDSGRNMLLTRATTYMQNIEKLLPQYFNTLPKAKCVVLPVEAFRAASSAGAFYEPSSEDGVRPGRFYVNMYNMESEKTYELEALVYHEALPGHHMQIAISQELKGVPDFRKYFSNSAYAEGWGLYSELLGKEMNLYNSLESEVGRLSMELFRAARLVVDVGIHEYKWSKEKATDYMIKNTLNSVLDCTREVERYFLWPGQATSYKIGMLEIVRLKNWSKKELDKQFDIKEFHDVVLKNGSVPLGVLGDLVKEWVNDKKK